jgi:hypothetical protein
MTQKYFLACSYPLAPGSVVNPGNWGRMIRKYSNGVFGDPWILLREEIFEHVRQSQFPTKPSRFEGIFLCETKDQLVQFLQENNRHLELVYEVELIDVAPAIHKGCLMHLDISLGETLSSFSRKANAYWDGANIKKPEILTTSGARIIAQLPS